MLKFRRPFDRIYLNHNTKYPGFCSALGSESLVWAIRALEALAHERTVARLQQESDDIPPSSPNPSRRGPPQPQVLSYDPASAFLLETMVSIVLKTPQYIEETWSVDYTMFCDIF